MKTCSLHTPSLYTRRFGAVVLFAALLLAFNTQGQGKKLKVFFAGNSFMAANDLPVVTSIIAKSMGDTLEFESNTPTAFDLELHSHDVITRSKIAKGDWNYIVLQEKAEKPAYPDAQIASEVYPYAKTLDSLIHDGNNCGRTVFFQTWGFLGGDATKCPTFPPVCTYEGMDSMAKLRYGNLTDSFKGIMAPVGEVFHQLISTASGINLFGPDMMHPSEAGTYASALTLYTVLFRNDPTTVAYNYTLTLSEANAIKKAVEIVVYNDPAKWKIGEYDPKVGFTYLQSASTVNFDASPCVHVSNYKWYFGDGDSSTAVAPTHIYKSVGTYNVTLYGDDCIITDSAKDVVVVTTLNIGELTSDAALRVFPNPAADWLQVELPSSVVLQNARLTISNMLGAEVLTVNQYNKRPLDISNLPNGMYVVSIENNGQILKQKFVRQ